MKKIFFFVILIASLSLTMLLSTYAHPGRTDSQGGHWDREDGSYHFHDGEYAGRTQSGSSASKNYEPFTPPYDPPQRESKADSHDFAYYFKRFLIGFGGLATSSLLFFLLYINRNRFRPSYRLEYFSEQIEELTKINEKLLDAILNQVFCESSISIPEDCEIGEDNLPREKSCKKDWGKTFTVYVTYAGNKLHSKFMCSGATLPQNIGVYMERDIDSLLCSRCKHHFTDPDLSWYKKHMEYNRMDRKIKDYENQLKKQYDNTEVCYKKCNTKLYKFFIAFSKKNRTELHLLNNKYIELKQNRNR